MVSWKFKRWVICKVCVFKDLLFVSKKEFLLIKIPNIKNFQNDSDRKNTEDIYEFSVLVKTLIQSRSKII